MRPIKDALLAVYSASLLQILTLRHTFASSIENGQKRPVEVAGKKWIEHFSIKDMPSVHVNEIESAPLKESAKFLTAA